MRITLVIVVKKQIEVNSLKFIFHGDEYVVMFPTKKGAPKSELGRRGYVISGNVTVDPIFG